MYSQPFIYGYYETLNKYSSLEPGGPGTGRPAYGIGQKIKSEELSIQNLQDKKLAQWNLKPGNQMSKPLPGMTANAPVAAGASSTLFEGTKNWSPRAFQSAADNMFQSKEPMAAALGNRFMQKASPPPANSGAPPGFGQTFANQGQKYAAHDMHDVEGWDNTGVKALGATGLVAGPLLYALLKRQPATAARAIGSSLLGGLLGVGAGAASDSLNKDNIRKEMEQFGVASDPRGPAAAANDALMASMKPRVPLYGLLGAATGAAEGLGISPVRGSMGSRALEGGLVGAGLGAGISAIPYLLEKAKQKRMQEVEQEQGE
jgi:hypothetical protein